jgi:hypothetical protein
VRFELRGPISLSETGQTVVAGAILRQRPNKRSLLEAFGARGFRGLELAAAQSLASRKRDQPASLERSRARFEAARRSRLA